MPHRGTDPFVEQVRAATDIVGVIQAYVELRRAGRRLRGLCPFHGEKTPSFFVHEENQTFYCFGCQQGGDVFQFLMLQEKLTFPEALHTLAERAGIPIPRERSRERTDDRLGEAMEVAAEFFRSRLRAPEGEAARRYLEGRGIGAGAVERFGLGWAPASWDALLQHARRLLPERILLQAGLVIEGERGLYDRFRERIIIPIRTAGGRTAAFGGRLLGPGEPKYLNSPETPLYKKGTVLFALGEARDGIRQRGDIVVVEGYFDVIALHAAGIDWAVGTCGTALTPEQAALMRRYSERWTLLFDGDRAGRAAVRRAMDAAVGVHPGLKIALCPDGLDPDDWVRQVGSEGVLAAFEHALSPLQYLEAWSVDERITVEQLLPRVAELLRKIGDPMIRERWVQEAAGRFHLTEARIWEVVGRSAGASPSPPKPAAAPALRPREKQIVSAAIRRPDLADEIRAICEELPDLGRRCVEVLRWVSARFDEGASAGAAILSLASEDPALVRDLAFLHEETVPDEGGEEGELVPEDLLLRMRRRLYEHRKREITDRIRRAEDRGEDVTILLREKQELAAALRGLEGSTPEEAGND